MVFSGHTGEILSYSGDMDAVTVTVRLKKPIEVRPGSYFYLYLPSRWAKYNFLHSVTAMVYWYPPEDGPGAVREVTFLLSRASYNAAIVTTLREGQFILLDGPYGQDLQLHKHQNVVLAAKGIGIAAILPLALDIGARRRHDDIVRTKLQKISYKLREVIEQKGKAPANELAHILREEKILIEEKEKLERKRLHRDAIKKVDLYWSLEDNSQMSWAQKELQALQKLDPDHVRILTHHPFPAS
jgi:NAD(P)H-flavin reductase